MVAWTKPADQWATEKAAEMLVAGYDAGPIIRKPTGSASMLRKYW